MSLLETDDGIIDSAVTSTLVCFIGNPGGIGKFTGLSK